MLRQIKERYLNGGIKALMQNEVVELILALNGTRKLNNQANELIEQYKTFQGVIDNDKSFATAFLRDVVALYMEQRMEEKQYLCRSSKEVFDFLFSKMRSLDKEIFEVLFLNSKNMLLKAETLFTGSLTSASIYPREVIAKALKYRSAAMIFSHNHPSGEPEPSDADREITKTLVLAACTMEIKPLDHIVIGAGKYFSFADAGLIREYEVNAKANRVK